MRAKATRRITVLGFAALAAGALLFPAPAQAQVINLCAGAGTVTMPDGVPVPIWGFALDTGPTSCDGVPDLTPDTEPGIPGPVIDVNEGSAVTVILRNTLAENVSIEFPGQDVTSPVAGTYTFTSAPGTYLYEAGTNPGVQIPMGLYGALIVRETSALPAPPTGVPPFAGKAYDNPATAFHKEQVLVLSEIDPKLNAEVDNNNFGENCANFPDEDACYTANDYHPVYWLINGEAYPDTDPISVPPGNRLLLRYLNAGSTHYTMELLGLRQRMIAVDSDPLLDVPPGPVDPNLSLNVASQTIPTGQTADAIVAAVDTALGVTGVPARPGRYPLYNRQMRITNAQALLPTPPNPANTPNPAYFPGGMMTFVTVPAKLYFSTAGNSGVPGVLPPFDNADIYAWSDGTPAAQAYARVFDAVGSGLPDTANIDALMVVDFNTFYMSFAANTTVPAPVGLVQDEDVVLYDAGAWSVYFDGTAVGLATNAPAASDEDVDAFEILGDGSVLVSTVGNPVVTGVTGAADADLLRCVGNFGPLPTTCAWTLYFDGSDVELTLGSEDVDGVAVSEVAGTDIYLSTTGAYAVTGIATGGESRDVFVCNNATTEPPGPTACTAGYTLFFDGGAEGLLPATGNNIDAFDLP